jgi:hypothetical protein
MLIAGGESPRSSRRDLWVRRLRVLHLPATGRPLILQLLRKDSALNQASGQTDHLFEPGIQSDQVPDAEHPPDK